MNEMSRENKDLKTAQNKGSVLKRLVRRILKFIELSRWFNRKSQHYILGNWACYVAKEKKIAYYKQYPIAWLKFIYHSRHDIFNA